MRGGLVATQRQFECLHLSLETMVTVGMGRGEEGEEEEGEGQQRKPKKKSKRSKGEQSYLCCVVVSGSSSKDLRTFTTVATM